MAAPFLMLGIGIDDAFVMLSAWHRTRPQYSVRERMAQTYAESAVSISITSITDMISFFIGTFTYFASVRVFCLYLGISVLMAYVWHITLFGACLALSGRAEKQQLHNITCKRVKSSWESCVVVVAFAAYLAVAVYGCTTFNDGLQLRKTARYDSYSIPFYDFTDKYFSSFAYRPMIVFTGNITYSDPANERQLLEFVEKSFLSGDINRYRADIVFSEDNSRIVASRCLVQSVNVMNAINDRRLMQDLRQWADESKFNVTVYHPLFIFFDHLCFSVLCFAVLYRDVPCFAVTLFAVPCCAVLCCAVLCCDVMCRAVLCRALSVVRSTILKAISCAALTMVLICVVFIPNPISSLCVGFAIVSIETGVIGYTSLWGVNFDMMSMIQLIMCVGFSVDFTAHISYSYLAAKVDTPEERVRECLTSLGLPVMQGALSTLIGVLPLMLIPSYMFKTFFKTVFLIPASKIRAQKQFQLLHLAL
ncbi:hypothetical protein HAZT_HAZT002796 [Hyalella azteca]|uniref:SSD domain-containing protein n=1 Tax=Hyalella azteca TaxID=294128 RepID=A0A6A0H3B4_HYAAZ|nr:hypothetical protein HAZT_HAZT002796 [Hyalella azteca]